MHWVADKLGAVDPPPEVGVVVGVGVGVGVEETGHWQDPLTAAKAWANADAVAVATAVATAWLLAVASPPAKFKVHFWS
jgi:hypothetical protein